MLIKRVELLQINHSIKTLLEDKSIKSKKLVYSLVKNSKIMEAEVEAIQKAADVNSPEFIEYNEKLKVLWFTYGQVDEEKGVLKTTPDGQSLILKDPAKKEELTEKIAALEVEYKDVLDQRTEEIKKYDDFLGEEIEVALLTLKFEDLPDEIEAEVIYNLDKIIEAPEA